MEYILLGLPVALVIWALGMFFRSRVGRTNVQPLVCLKQTDHPMQNRFISPRAQRNLELRRDLAKAALVTKEAANPKAQMNSHQARADFNGERGSRNNLRTACLALLDASAIEHPSGHIKLAGRYILWSKNDDRIEMMFERGEKSMPHLWMAERHAPDTMGFNINTKFYPASQLYKQVEDEKDPAYGRHSALKSMRDLANADLVRFTIDHLSQLEVILTRLSAPLEKPVD